MSKRTGDRRKNVDCLQNKLFVGGVKQQNGEVLSYGHKRKAIIDTDISEYETNVN